MVSPMSFKLFTEQFNKSRESRFLIRDDVVHSFSDLAKKVDEKSAYLIEACAGKTSLVLVGDYDIDSIAYMLAAIKCSISFTLQTEETYEILHDELSEIGFQVVLFTNTNDLISMTPVEQDTVLSDSIGRFGQLAIFFSSGSTGRPKAIVHKLPNLLDKFVGRDNKKFTSFVFLQFDHMGGFNTLLAIFFGGGCAVAIADRDPNEVARLIEKYSVQLLPATPTFLSLLIISKAYLKYDLSCLRVISYGTETMSESLLTRLYELFPGVKLKQTYGLSEIGVVPTVSKSSDSTYFKIVGEQYQTKIVNGILKIKAPSTMIGKIVFSGVKYGFQEVSHEQWFDTNDVVEQDGEFIRVLGRDSDIINVGGNKVYPAEIESCLFHHPAIDEVVVLPKKNAVTGFSVHAKVVLSPASDVAIEGLSIRRFARETLPKYACPASYDFVDSLPKTSRFKRDRAYHVED